MASAFTYTGTSPDPIMAAFLQHRSDLPVALVERISQIGFLESTQVPGPQADDIEVRAFGEGGELRWRQDSGSWYAFLLSDTEGTPAPSGFTAESDHLSRSGEPLSYTLWGERKEGPTFREGQRLPQPIHYPGVTGSHAAIQVALYSVDSEEAEHPLPSLVRYVKLVPAHQE